MEFIKRNPKIFILSGIARSGKGETAKIIKNFYSNRKSITISFGYYIKDYAKRVSDWDGNEDTKPRELLQQLGIELVKDKIDDKLFIRRILEDIEIFSYFYDIIIIDDARLVDEIETLKEKFKDSISIRIKRKNFINDLTADQKKHLTEIALDNYNNFDYIIEINNLEELNKQIVNILKEV